MNISTIARYQWRQYDELGHQASSENCRRTTFEHFWIHPKRPNWPKTTQFIRFLMVMHFFQACRFKLSNQDFFNILEKHQKRPNSQEIAILGIFTRKLKFFRFFFVKVIESTVFLDTCQSPQSEREITQNLSYTSIIIIIFLWCNNSN